MRGITMIPKTLCFSKQRALTYERLLLGTASILPLIRPSNKKIAKAGFSTIPPANLTFGHRNLYFVGTSNKKIVSESHPKLSLPISLSATETSLCWNI